MSRREPTDLSEAVLTWYNREHLSIRVPKNLYIATMATVNTFFMVGIGGAVGSMARYGVSVWLPWDGKGLPLATFLVNVVGCLVLGAVSGADPKGSSWPESWTSLVAIGICGGLTTFSTFSAESATLLELGRPLGAALYVVGSTLGGVCTFLVGAWVSQRFLL